MDGRGKIDRVTMAQEGTALSVHKGADALRSTNAEQQAFAKREDLIALQEAVVGLSNKHVLVMDGMLELISSLLAKLDAQSYALSGVAGLALSHTGYSGQRLFDIIINEPGYAPINDQVEPILRRIFSARPRLKVVE